MPYFSIVIPVYNKRFFVAKTLKSVLAQTFTDYEIIIVNDGSTDDSDAIIQSVEDKRIRYFLKENQGVATARNFGLEKATSDYVCFLDADDYWYPGFLETMTSIILENPEQKVFSSAIEIEIENKAFPAGYSIDKKSAVEIVDFFDASQQECVLWTSGSVFQKDVFKNVGNFDTNIQKGEDTELWIRIGLRYPIVFAWKILTRYVYDKNGVSRNLNYYFEPYVFEKYAILESENPKLKHFLDLNRFSAVIKCKLSGDFKTATMLYKQIDLDTIGWKKVIILQFPRIVLKMLVGVKNSLAKTGFGKSVFR